MLSGFKDFLWRKRLRTQSAETVFTDIFKRNYWQGKDSLSGRGSDTTQTQKIIAELPKIFRELGVESMLDIPCGDFHWMRHVDLGGIRYIGGDIVKDIVTKNAAFLRDGVEFRHMNLLESELPKVDLIFCRDCLVHLSFEHVKKAIQNIKRSGAKYLMTTTFSERKSNQDIVTGQWRTLNLTKEPFNLPKPFLLLNEGCTENNNSYTDKCLGVWKLDQL